MKNLLRDAIEKKKQHLINKLIASGIYKEHDQYLFKWTLTDIENEYKFIKEIKQ